jgi:hypothetical protein
VALGTGVTEADYIVPPERLCIDQGPCHPWLVRREPDGLEGTIRNAQGRLPEALAVTGRKPETRVIARITLQEDKGDAPRAKCLEPVSHQGRADTALLVLRQDGQRAEYLHLNQPPGGIEQTAGKHRVPGDPSVVLGDQRQTARRRDGVPQGIDQVGHHKAVVTERPQVDVPYRLSVGRTFFANFHARRVGATPGRSHPVFEPEGRGDRWPDASRQGKDSKAELVCRA